MTRNHCIDCRHYTGQICELKASQLEWDDPDDEVYVSLYNSCDEYEGYEEDDE